MRCMPLGAFIPAILCCAVSASVLSTTRSSSSLSNYNFTTSATQSSSSPTVDANFRPTPSSSSTFDTSSRVNIIPGSFKQLNVANDSRPAAYNQLASGQTSANTTSDVGKPSRAVPISPTAAAYGSKLLAYNATKPDKSIGSAVPFGTDSRAAFNASGGTNRLLDQASNNGTKTIDQNLLTSPFGNGSRVALSPSNGTNHVQQLSYNNSKAVDQSASVPPFSNGTQPSPLSINATNTTSVAEFNACGLCYGVIPELKVAYFPPNLNATGTFNNDTKPLITPAPHPRQVRKRLNPPDGQIVMVTDGYTFTYPSLYLELVSGIHVTNSCGHSTRLFQQSTIGLASGVLSTLSYNIPLGAKITDGSGAKSYAKPAEAKDFANPSWGLDGPWNTIADQEPFLGPMGAAPVVMGNGQLVQEISNNVAVGPPFYPIILLPQEIYSIAPGWHNCLSNLVEAAFPIFDPPKPLDSASLLVAPVSNPAQVTAAPDNAGPSPSPIAVPAPSPNPPLPAASPESTPPATGTDPSKAVVNNPAPPANPPPANPPPANPPPANPPPANPLPANQPPANPAPANPPPANPAPANLPPANPPPVNGPQNSPVIAAVNQNPNPANPAASLASPQDPAQNNVVAGNTNTNPQGAVQNNGAGQNNIVTVNVNPVPQNPAQVNAVANGNPTPAPAPVLTVGGTPYTANSASNFVIAGQTLNANTPITVSNTPISLLPGSSAVALGPAIQPLQTATPPAVLTVGGSSYTANSASQFVIAGQTLQSNSPITVANTPISIVPGGSAVAVGTQTQALQTASPPAVLTVGGTPYTANSASQFVIAGQTLKSGSPITVSNTPISFVPGQGAVAIGGQTQSLANAKPPAVLTYNGTPYTANSASAFVIAGQTLNPTQPITVSGTPVSLLPDGAAVAIGAPTTQPFSYAAPSSGPALTVGGSTFHPGPSSDYVIGGQSLAPGGQITVSGTPISLAPGGSVAVVGSSTQNLGPTSAEPALTVGGSTYHTNSASDYVIGGQTLAPGAQITVSGTPISLAPGGSVAVVGSSTQNLGPSSAAPALTFGGSTFTPGASSDYVVGGQTLAPGSQITVSGTRISLAPDGSMAVVGSSTENLAPTPVTPAPQPVLTFGGTTFHPDASSDYTIDGQTLTPGAKITVSGTPISLAPDGSIAVVGSSTENLSPAFITAPPQPVLTFDGTTFHPDASSDYTIDGQTLTPGAKITVSGTAISLAPDGSTAVVGSTTEALVPSSVFTVGGQTFTANPSSFVLDGTTMTPGVTMTISGTPVVLEPSGVLEVGSTEIPIATGGSGTKPNSPAQGKPVVGGQSRLEAGKLCLVLGVVAVFLFQ